MLTNEGGEKAPRLWRGHGERLLVSVVSPAFNESRNVPLLYRSLVETFQPLAVDWEWVVVDDHSTDETFQALVNLAGKDSRVRGFRLARNAGSHAALVCGLHQARGDCVVVLAADLQDPPELIPDMLKLWREGYHIVWAVRRRREGIKKSSLWFSRLYYYAMRHLFGLKELPETGADFFLADKRVIEALKGFHERNVNLMALLAWMGFRHTRIDYDKKARIYGRSGWNFAKKIKLFIDSVASFSYLPIRAISVIGFITAMVGFLYAGVVVINALRGAPPQGWASLMVVVLVIGGVQMIMMGVLGEYLWRAFDETRRRPKFIIEETTVHERAGPGRRASPCGEANAESRTG
uniref:Glycosyltransferase n=1 Tax=Desulfacinum infernum TaxID=35837 RepID=A0A832A8K9_9BACT